jgi:molybdate transport system substrate-binding protein
MRSGYWPLGLLAATTAALLVPAMAACGLANPSGNAPDELVVFAASSLTDAFEATAAPFARSDGGTPVAFNFGASSQLAVQLIDGAPADVFASANEKQMASVQQAGLLLEPPVVLATNKLVLIVPTDNPAGIEAFTDLSRPAVRIVTAVPGVPIRAYTDELLDELSTSSEEGKVFRQAFYANIVSEEDNVRQAAAKVALGEADAAIVYASDAASDLEPALRVLPVPNSESVQARYYAAVLRSASHPAWGRAYIQFLRSRQGQAVLASWGFGPLEDHD